MLMDKSNYSRLLPKCVVIYQNRRQMKKEIKKAEESDKTEKSLCNHFKCSNFQLKCFFTTADFRLFKHHLKNYHKTQQFYCLYCYSQKDEDKKFMSAEQLVSHMIEVHRFRRYQCNLCLYRAISAEHVDIHQSVIHSDIHKSTLQHKQLDGKSCKILECPPATIDSAKKTVPSEVKLYQNHKYRRLNNDENHNKDFQCVYCNFMNQNISKVVEHCVQTHPDYHILYYVPEPLVTSTVQRPPIRPQQFREIDVFNPEPEGDSQEQDNRVTSTASEAILAYQKNKQICNKEVEELSFKKKNRVSAYQKGITSAPFSSASASKAGLSNKFLNKDHYKKSGTSTFRRKGVSSSSSSGLALLRLGKPITNTNRFNQPKSMPKSAREDLIKRNNPYMDPKRKAVYESEDSDEPTPKKVSKIANRAQKSTLPSLISPKKLTDRKMVCKICDGNQRKFFESEISSHITMYHDAKLAKKNNMIPFMCGFCQNFFDSEGTASVIAHQRSYCSKKPEDKELSVEKMIITEEEYFKDKPNEKKKHISKDSSTEKSVQRSRQLSGNRTNSKSDEMPKKSKPKTNRKLNLLSDDEYEAIISPPVLRKQSSVPSKFKQTLKNNNSRDDNRKQKKRTDSSSSVGYQSSDSSSSVPDLTPEIELSDSPSPKASTSRQTTTIEIAEPDSDEEKCEFVCLFCDKSFIIKNDAIDHLETHLLDLNEAKEDPNSKQIDLVKKWFKKFFSNQISLFEDERDIDDNEFYYKCPICVRIARIKNLRPKRFRTFWELRSHFWEHTFWTPVTCLLCRPSQELPNCDYLIAKHLNANHSDELLDSDEPLINKLRGNKMKGQFTEGQRWALENEFIETDGYEPIDKLIENILNEITEEREQQLRKQAENEIKGCVVLPKLVLSPLPSLNFDDDEMITHFITKNELKNHRKNGTQSKPNKPLDVINVGSSSDESSDEEQPIVIVRHSNKKQPLLLESDDESMDNDINAQNEETQNEGTQNGETQNGETQNEEAVSPMKRYLCNNCNTIFNHNHKSVWKDHYNNSHPGVNIVFSRI